MTPAGRSQRRTPISWRDTGFMSTEQSTGGLCGVVASLPGGVCVEPRVVVILPTGGTYGKCFTLGTHHVGGTYGKCFRKSLLHELEALAFMAVAAAEKGGLELRAAAAAGDEVRGVLFVLGNDALRGL